VRDAGRFSDGELGVPLMRRAFHPETGPLTDKSALPAEPEALASLFEGAIVVAKNPWSHREFEMTKVEAARLLLSASHWGGAVPQLEEPAGGHSLMLQMAGSVEPPATECTQLRRVCSNNSANGNGFANMIEAYLDETGIHDGAPFCVIAGFFGGLGQWGRFDSAWRRALSAFDVPLDQFHALDLMRGRKFFFRLGKRPQI
jgi:Protein of unknown function (Hypoth_ymh)